MQKDNNVTQAKQLGRKIYNESQETKFPTDVQNEITSNIVLPFTTLKPGQKTHVIGVCSVAYSCLDYLSNQCQDLSDEQIALCEKWKDEINDFSIQATGISIQNPQKSKGKQTTLDDNLAPKSKGKQTTLEKFQ